MTAVATKSKKVAPKPVAKAKGKAAAKKAPVTRAKKEGLRKPQVRILQCLSKGKEMSRADISEKAPVDVAACVEYLGSDDAAVRKANDAKHFPSLISLGFVTHKAYPTEAGGEGPTMYQITAKGRTALKNADA